MTAIDRAAEIIHTDFGFSDPLFRRRAERIAEALAAANPPLLVTDEVLRSVFTVGWNAGAEHEDTDGNPDDAFDAYLASRGETMTAECPHLVPAGAIGSTYVRNLMGPGDNYRVMWYPDGSARFEHRCDRGERGVVVCAPLLSDQHTIEQRQPLTIAPSILCSDCGTHGFIRNGRWVPA